MSQAAQGTPVPPLIERTHAAAMSIQPSDLNLECKEQATWHAVGLLPHVQLTVHIADLFEVPRRLMPLTKWVLLSRGISVPRGNVKYLLV